MVIDDVLQGQNYNSNYEIILNSFIREYDISKANINALYSRGVIDKAMYDNLYSADKAMREKTIGLMIRDNQNIYKEIQAGIMEAKRNLILTNNIDLEDIVSIKNDAVFVMGNKLENTVFGLMDFKLKNTYTMYIKINRYEFYYYFNPYNSEELLDVKGISDDKLVLHERYFMDFLLALFNVLQIEGILPALKMLHNFSIGYINRQLDPGFYRMFNGDSSFDILYNGSCMKSLVYVNDVSIIDIRYNYEILRDLYKVISSMYFKKVKE